MVKAQQLFEYFEKPRAIKTLVVLFENPSIQVDTLLNLIGGSKSTGMKRIKELSQLGLLSKEASLNEPKRIFYKLNSKGIKIAKSIISIGEELDE